MSHPTPRAAPRRVLEDASGRRLQRMRWVGRVVALLFLVWLAVVILGGLGVGPVARIPLAHVLRPSAGPPPLRTLPRPVPPAPSDLTPALPAPQAAAAVPAARSAAPGRSAKAPGRVGATTTTHGKAASAPGHTSTTAHGRSAAAPGRVRRTTTTTTTTTAVHGKKLGHGKKP